MLSLTNKRILLGITGGIAAYKCAELTRLLIKAGAGSQGGHDTSSNPVHYTTYDAGAIGPARSSGPA